MEGKLAVGGRLLPGGRAELWFSSAPVRLGESSVSGGKKSDFGFMTLSGAGEGLLSLERENNFGPETSAALVGSTSGFLFAASGDLRFLAVLILLGELPGEVFEPFLWPRLLFFFVLFRLLLIGVGCEAF